MDRGFLGQPPLVDPKEAGLIAAEQEAARQTRRTPAGSALNNNPVARTLSAISNRKKIKALTKQKKDNRSLITKKNRLLRRLKIKLLTQEIRAAAEAVSGVGIPVALYEIYKLYRKNGAIKKLKKEIRALRLEQTKIDQQIRRQFNLFQWEMAVMERGENNTRAFN